MAKKYKRILLKLSGEQFEGERDHGIDPVFLKWIAGQIKHAKTVSSEIIIVVGGGNMIRGASVADNGIERTAADYMGMLATIINAVAMTAALENAGMEARLMTRLRAESVAEPYIHRRALRHLEKGRVVIIGGGTGNPYVTTDTAAVQAAVELHCDVVLKATKVDGVYDKDPVKHQDAKKLDSVTFKKAIEDDGIRVMDKTALAMAAENSMPVVVFDLEKEDNIFSVVSGEAIGTKVS